MTTGGGGVFVAHFLHRKWSSCTTVSLKENRRALDGGLTFSQVNVFWFILNNVQGLLVTADCNAAH